MGKIVGLKATNDEKVIVSLELTQLEALKLKGNLEKIHIFSENTLGHIAKLVQRGKRESTKYFLLPKSLRVGVLPSNEVKCDKIETKTKNIFIFEVKKY